MLAVLGLVLAGLILYTSTLDYTLPLHSRSRLAEFLHNGEKARWLPWLAVNEIQVLLGIGFVRLALAIALAFVLVEAMPGAPPQSTDWTRFLLAAGILAVLLAFGAVVLPLVVAVHAGEPILARSLGVLFVLNTVMWPLRRLFAGVDALVRRTLGKDDHSVDEQSERAELQLRDAVTEGEAVGAVDEEQKAMIESILQLRETPVSAIMTPRTDINGVPADATVPDIKAVVFKYGHSRIPVFDGTIDHIIGVVYAKDLLRYEPHGGATAREIMRTVPYVPETKSLDELLDEFRTTKVQIAIVLDEYGGTAGMATIEDILEELVGDIDDEYDQSPPSALTRIDGDSVEVDARVHVSEINAELEIELPEEQDYETIGGFVFATLGRVPASGESFTHENIGFEVLSAEPRKINRLRIRVQRQPQNV